MVFHTAFAAFLGPMSNIFIGSSREQLADSQNVKPRMNYSACPKHIK